MSLRDIIVGSLTLSLISLPAMAAPETNNYQYTPPSNYVGIGGTVELEDDADLGVVINSKFKVTNVNRNLSLSVRPAVLFVGGEDNNNVAVNLPLTIEGTVAPRVHPYAGAGIQVDVDRDDSTVRGLLTTGVDVTTSRNTLVNVSVNYVPESTYGSEVSAVATFGYSF